ncbi:MAG: hypothetical protein H0X51_06435 [Parachlamydiaceae bacterium]|nr:hypothetical protein [Parachlamydiaceae bacterium]
MKAVFHEEVECVIHREIHQHDGWYGSVTGLKAAELLKDCAVPYTYVLRAGECATGNEADYYVSFVQPDFTIKHQPFIITVTKDGWTYANYGAGGPYKNASIDDVLYMIMHCKKDELQPLVSLVLR